MRKFFVLLAVVLLVASTATAFARVAPGNGYQFMDRAPKIGQAQDDMPVRMPAAARTDTINFGFYNPVTGYAVLGEKWTWDHGAADPLEGWTSVDGTQNIGAFFRQITSTNWGGHGNTVAAPLITGAGSVWIGVFEDQADALCWQAGLGYGNAWCQRLTSPTLSYSGSGGITLRFKYFNDTETDFDYTKVFLAKGATLLQLNESAPNAADGFTDKINITCNPNCALSIPATPWERVVTAAQMGAAGNYTIRFQFESDGGWSDEDGDWDTQLGPFGADDVAITGGTSAAYNFDANLQGWTASTCPAVGSYFAVHPISDYNIPDPCGCVLSGNVISFHDPSFGHPDGQKEAAFSNIVDRTAYINYNQIFADFDMYADLPQANGVFYRPGWDYYPYLCEVSGQTTWSGRQGQDTWHYVGDTPDCVSSRNIATAWGIPSDAQYVKFVYEVYSSCEDFGIPPTQCTGVTNFSPLLDNVQVRMTGVPNAPSISFTPGSRFADGFPQVTALETNSTGNADIVRDLNMQNENLVDKLGDSLMVTGPAPTPAGAGRWDSRLYLRVRREGPAQRTITRYNTWLFKVADGLNIVGANAPFTFGWMDSVETAFVQKNQFCSQFKENDDDFTAPEQGEDNEIIWDNMLTPGTKIEYFVASNFTCTPNEQYLLPDTTGKFYLEMEMLPSYRMDAGVAKFPCVLYVDAFNAGAQIYIENALNVVLHGAGPLAPIPDPARWDRYDYIDATSNWVAPLFRGGPAGTNAGASLPELIGYRTIMVSAGDAETGIMEPRDWVGFGEWLQYVDCAANTPLQGLILNGDNLAEIIQLDGATFLNDYMGATFRCSDYYDPTCPPGDPDNDQNMCVRLEYAPGGPWVPTLASDVFANWCPTRLSYDVLGTNGGVGNKVYSKIGTGTLTQYAQITNDRRGPANPNNYRTVLDGFSYHHMTKRDLGNPGPASECPTDSASIVEASYSEIRSAIRWTFNIANPLDIGLCLDPCNLGPGSDVPDQAAGGKINMLFQNNPNPFNPRTAIKFSLAADGPAKLIIYDVNGREVKTLVNGHQAAGPHEIVWDGTDNSGHAVGSGVYWSQLTAGDYNSNKKMVVLK